MPTWRHARLHDVAGAVTIVEDGGDGFVDQVGFRLHGEGIAQAHGERHDRGDGVGLVLARDVGRRAVDRFVERALFAGLGVARAQRGRRQHADRARQLRRFVGQDVAEQIVGDDDVELLRVAHELHGAVVGEDVGEFDVLVFGGVEFRDLFLPEQARGHHVVLFGGGDFVAAQAREFEGDAGDAVDFVRRVNLRVDGAAFAVGNRGDAARFAEIDAAREFAHDHDVEAGDDFGLERRRGFQRVEADRGAQVCEQAEVFAQAEQGRLGAFGVGNARPSRAAHRAEEHGVRVHRLLHRGFGDGRAVLVVGRAADEVAVDLELRARLGVEPGDDALDLGHHFGADAVAGEEEQSSSSSIGSLTNSIIRWMRYAWLISAVFAIRDPFDMPSRASHGSSIGAVLSLIEQ